MNRRLYRSNTERVLGGVAGGLAEYFDLDPALVRVAWAVLILASGGVFLLLYIVMWFVVPEAPPGFLSGGQPWPGSPSGEAETPSSAGEQSDGDPAAGAPPTPPPSVAHEWARRRARRRSGGGALVFGSLLILLGVWFLIGNYLPWLRIGQLWPLILVLLGLLLLYTATRSRAD